MKKMPKTIYVRIEDEGTENEYLNAKRSFEEIDEDGNIGVYELKEVKKRRTEFHLE